MPLLMCLKCSFCTVISRYDVVNNRQLKNSVMFVSFFYLWFVSKGWHVRTAEIIHLWTTWARRRYADLITQSLLREVLTTWQQSLERRREMWVWVSIDRKKQKRNTLNIFKWIPLTRWVFWRRDDGSRGLESWEWGQQVAPALLTTHS